MTSVGYNLKIFCVDVNMELTPLPSDRRHPSEPDPLRGDVINGCPPYRI